MENATLRGKLERAIVRALLAELRRARYLPVKVWDGGEYVNTPDADSVIAAVFAVDEATIHFEPMSLRARGGNRGVAIVLGNGEDCISDWTAGDPRFSAAVERACERAGNARVII